MNPLTGDEGVVPLLRKSLRVCAEHKFRSDPEAVRRAIITIMRLSDEKRAVCVDPEAEKDRTDFER